MMKGSRIIVAAFIFLSLYAGISFAKKGKVRSIVDGFVTFRETRCDADGMAIEIITGVIKEKECIRACKRNKRCNVATFNRRKSDCRLFDVCPGFQVNHNNTDKFFEFSTSGRVKTKGKREDFFLVPQATSKSSNGGKCNIDCFGTRSSYFFDDMSLDKCINQCNKEKGCVGASIREEPDLSHIVNIPNPIVCWTLGNNKKDNTDCRTLRCESENYQKLYEIAIRIKRA